jgi:hypothetical protein
MSRPRRLAEGEDLWSMLPGESPVDPGIPALAKRSSDSDLEQSANTDIMVRRQRSA